MRISLSIGRRPATSPHPDCFDWYVNPDDRHQVNLHEVLERAAQNNITSILVEGGGEVFGSFVREKLADKVQLLISTRFLGAGVDALGKWRAPSLDDAVRLIDSEVRWLGRDLLITGYPDYDHEQADQREEETEAPAMDDTDEVEGDPVIESVSVDDEAT
ncbi:MAG: dihydrofolate reductase family protein [candidate division Zixibacteria bacterium]|nr:dihydrofolate reductase family protein [candidate division Zixibacteria bacterium]